MVDFDNYPEINVCKTRSNYPTTFFWYSLERREKKLLDDIYFIFLHKTDQTVQLFFQVNLIIFLSRVMIKNGQ